MDLKTTLKENNYSLIASNGYFSSETGIRPVIVKIVEKKDFFKDLTVADKVIGKASALLLVYSGVKQIQAVLMSEGGRDVLEKHGVSYEYEHLVDYIVNQKGDGMCPMELTVKDINDPEDAYEALKRKLGL